MSEAELKGQIKSLNKDRAALAKDDRSGRAAISGQIKATKKALSNLNLRTTQAPEVDLPECNERPDFVEPITVSDESLDGWNEFIAKHPSSHYHSLEWREIFKHCMNRELHYLTARTEKKEIVGILPIAITRSKLFGCYGVSLPYVNYGGPIGLADNVESTLIESAFSFVDRWALTHIEIRDTKSRPGFSTRNDKVCMYLDLEGVSTFHDLQQLLPAKVRSQVKKALGNGMSFQFGGIELLGDFYHVFAHHMRDLGTPVYGRELFATILQKFPDDASLVIGYSGSAPVSCAFLLANGGEWEIPWASTLRAANRINANMALYASVLDYIIQKRGSRFDFGRSTIDAPTHKFKKQWGAVEVPCYWYYSNPHMAGALTTDSKKFALAIKAWQRLPLPIANLLGPRLVRNLP